MNMKLFTRLCLPLLMMLMAMPAWSYTMPKREFRSAWVATVWALDWPTIGAGAEKQKQQLDRILDSLQVNNFNAVNLQVRSMCDAMYKSSYEPWSSYLTGTRGQDPGFDPLAYCVEGCHKRGMECHAWVNPYRFSTGSNWNTEQDQKLKEEGWLLTWGNTVILDPGQQRTINRIVDVCREIIANYDVDGILYDDYFYPNGIPTTSEADDYDEWNSSGVDMTFADWRRDNVNRMVKAVYDMIQEVRPDVRFGISPAGVAASSASVANQYGVEPCPAGSDWQYNGIFSDPLAWISNHTIDYISPQVYWKIGSTNDYSLITPWWNKVAAKFGRHCYISESISSITASSGDNEYQEYANEAELNRTSSLDGNPGSIFYSVKYLYALKSASLGNYLKRTVFTKPALPPVISWKEGHNPGVVTDLTQGDGKLTWQGYDNVRYTVYAFPATMNTQTFAKQIDYLLGFTYDSEFTLSEGLQHDYQYAVCVMDRLGNEWDPAFLSIELEQLDNPQLIAPDHQAAVDAPFRFSWHSVADATSYSVEIATDSVFDTVLESFTTADTTASVLLFSKLSNGTPCYWRVQAKAPARYSGVSEVRCVTPRLLTVTYPADGDEDVPQSFTAAWYTCGSDAEATLQIAGDDSFSPIVFTGTSSTGQLLIPDGVLEVGNVYFMRVMLTVDGETMTSPAVRFSVVRGPSLFTIPASDGAIVFKGQHIMLHPQEWATGYVIEISASATSWGRTRFIETLKDGACETTLPADSIKVNNKYLESGNTYYARTKTSYQDFDGNTHSTGFSQPVAFVYLDHVPGDVNGDGSVTIADANAIITIILNGSDGLDADTVARADVNGDGSVTIADANAVIAIILRA